MSNKKPQDGKAGANESRRDFLKKTGLGIGAAAAVPVGFLAQVLEVKAAIQQDGALIDRAAAQVEASARKGARGNALSLMDQYRSLGGSSRDVISVLQRVDGKLARIKAFERYNKGAIDRAVSEAIVEHVGPQGAGASDKANLYDVRGSAAREMFDRGGSPLKSHLTRVGVRVPGYNASRSQVAPQMAPTQQHLQPMQIQPMTPGVSDPTQAVPGAVNPTLKR